jgi:hypothetical protein
MEVSMGDLPTADPETFIGEFAEMDLSEIKDKVFLVALSTGDPTKPKFIPESVCGPLDFFEMVETVANVHMDQQIHAKAMIPSKKFGEKPKVLDSCTIDYIEAKYAEILMEALLTGELEKKYTCKAGFIDYEENKGETAEQNSGP